jgi:superfamily I DNA/RNA helicase
MTRAKTRLHVCAARERYKKPAELSRFVYEYLGKQ